MRAIILLCVACTSPSMSGELQSAGGVLGTWTFVPRSCRSGDAREFYGVDLGDGTRAVRLIQDPPKGYTFTVALGGDPANPTAIFDQAGCTQFDATLGEDDGSVTGSFDIDCSTNDGGGVHGEIEFANCGT